MLLKSKICVETFCDAVNVYRSTRKIIVCLYAVAYNITLYLFTYLKLMHLHSLLLIMLSICFTWTTIVIKLPTGNRASWPAPVPFKVEKSLERPSLSSFPTCPYFIINCFDSLNMFYPFSSVILNFLYNWVNVLKFWWNIFPDFVILPCVFRFSPHKFHFRWYPGFILFFKFSSFAFA